MFDIEVKNLRKTYGRGKKNVVAVDDVSFSVKKGEIFGLLGVNGAGKTTTINMITGLLEKDSGSIKVLGKDPKKDWEFVKNKTNVSTAYFPLSDVLTLKQNLKVYAGIYNVKNSEKRIDELLELFEMKRLENTKVVNMSSGEKTRTALCKGLINKPKVLFLDECTVGLDPDIAEKTRKIIKDYQEENNASILFTSHYMYEVEELCDRIAFMENGKVIKVATSEELKKTIKKRTIEVTMKDIAGLKNFLESEDVNVIKTKTNTLIFEVKGDQSYKTLSNLFAEGFKIEDLHITRPNLDDVFIRFARGENEDS